MFSFGLFVPAFYRVQLLHTLKTSVDLLKGRDLQRGGTKHKTPQTIYAKLKGLYPTNPHQFTGKTKRPFFLLFTIEGRTKMLNKQMGIKNTRCTHPAMPLYKKEKKESPKDQLLLWCSLETPGRGKKNKGR